MAYSFYGGKEGRTYNLVAHYNSIHDMVDAFSGGGSYTDVGYNEYVIINTYSKSNKENGIIYRRGLNYQEPFNPNNLDLTNNTIALDDFTKNEVILKGVIGQQYSSLDPPTEGEIAEVKVPKYLHYKYTINSTAQGPIPPDVTFVLLKEQRFDEDETKYSKFDKDFSNFVKNPGAGAIYVGQIVGPQGESPEIQMEDWESFERDIEEKSPIPGSYGTVLATKTPGYYEKESGEKEYNDKIDYGWYNIRDQHDNIIGAMLAFNFPYDVFKYTAETESPYGPKIIDVEELPSESSEIDRNAYYRLVEDGEYTYYLFDTVSVDKKDEEAPGSLIPIWRDVSEFLNEWPWRVHRKIPVIRIIQVNELPDTGEKETYYWIPDATGDTDGTYWEYERKNETPWTEIEDFDSDILYYRDDDYYKNNYYDYIKDEEEEEGRFVEIERNDSRLSIISLRDYEGLSREKGESIYHNYFNSYDIKIPKGIHGTSMEPIEIDDEYTLRTALRDYSNREEGDIILPYETTLRVVKEIDMECISGQDIEGKPILRVEGTYSRERLTEGLPKRGIDENAYYQVKEENEEEIFHYFKPIKNEEVWEWIEVEIIIPKIIRIYEVPEEAPEDETAYNYYCFKNTYYKWNIVSKQWEIIEPKVYPTGKLIVTYYTKNEDGEYETDLLPATIIDNSYLEENGDLHIILSSWDESKGKIKRDNLIMEPKVEWVKSIYFDEDNSMHVLFNSGKDQKTPFQSRELIENSIFIENDNNKPQSTRRFKAKYKSGYNEPYDPEDPEKERTIKTIEEYISNPINEIVDVKNIGDNLIVLWSDPAYRENLTRYIEKPYPIDGEGQLYKWEVLGPIYYGEHIFGHYNTLEELREEYPIGFTDESKKGWVATVGDSITEINLYAYDYRGNKGWYQIYSVSSGSVDPQWSLVIAEDAGNNTPKDLNEKLQVDGYWFVETDTID